MDTIERANLLVDSLMSEMRRKIITKLIERPRNISDLARELEKDRSTIAYHLDLLEKSGLVKSEYRVLEEPHSPGKLGNFFEVDPKVLKEAIDLATKEINVG